MPNTTRKTAKPEHLGRSQRDKKSVSASTERIAETLRTRIGNGELLPDSPLRELPLSQELGATRFAVHAALQSLEADYLVESLPNRGYFVSHMTLQDAQDIYEAREVLEGLAARSFAIRATLHQVNALRGAVERFAVAVEHGEIDGMVQTNNEFWEVLYRGSGNRVIIGLLQALRQRILVLRRRTLSQPDRPKETLREIQAILGHLETAHADKAGESVHADQAEQASRHHIRMAARVAYNILRESRLNEASRRS